MKRSVAIRFTFGFLGVAVLALLVLTFVLFKKPVIAPTNNASLGDFLTTTFTEVKTSNFVTSSPRNNEFLPTSPNTVSVTFKQAVSPKSTTAVIDALQQPAHLGRATFSDDRLTMTSLLRTGAAGPLKVTYQACALNGTCQTGTFGFTIRPL